jgi:hypothetical protein
MACHVQSSISSYKITALYTENKKGIMATPNFGLNFLLSFTFGC